MRADLRLPLLGACAWLGGLAAALLASGALPHGAILTAACVGGVVVAVASARLAAGPRTALTGGLLVLAAVAAVGLLRHDQVARSPVAVLAERHAVVHAVGTVTADPRVVEGAFADTVLVRLEVREVATPTVRVVLRVPVVVLGDAGWRRLPLGARVRTEGRLQPSRTGEEAAALRPRGDARVVREPDLWWRAAGRVRRAVRASVAHRPEAQRALVPALVDGDDTAVPPTVAEDFRTTGLTHLLAVSGTNLTLVVGFLLGVARWCRVRGRWLAVVAVLGIAGFVLLARTEPSVLRAAVMGAVGLLAMGANGRGRALRALGAAVLALMLVDPALATSAGFALSVLATGGILLLGPPWRDALARWLPRWLAEAVAVPVAAQLACTPLVAALSARVSLAAVGANLLAEPAVGPATVLGLSGGVAGLVCPPAGRLLGTVASWCVGWIALVADHGAALPAAAIGWGTGTAALVLLTGLTLAVALAGPRVARHRGAALACAVLLVVAVAVRLPTPGWPPARWVLVACDVGQGDALAVRTGPGSAVVVDAGPDPGPAERCLDRLGIAAVPLLVLTHFHADHVGGLAGVLAGRRVAAIETTRLADPPEAVAAVRRAAARAGVPVSSAAYGTTRRFGAATLQVLWPPADSPVRGPGDGSTANEASVVLLVETEGLRLLLTGDVEPEGQQVLARRLEGLRVDVLKVPHHGSRYQDEDWLLSLGARVALTSVGAGNDYGHPARSTLDPLTAAGTAVYRTDRDGTVAVVPTPHGPAVVRR